MRSDATLSPCGLYRYTLTREWGSGPRMLFVMLNPSTADADKDDPTIRRCIAFAKREGCGSLEVVNLHAYRTPDPRMLWSAQAIGVDIIGPNNRGHILDARRRADIVVCAWGANPVDKQYAAAVSFAPVWCLGTTKDGSPRHPLFVRADAPLVWWAVP